ARTRFDPDAFLVTVKKASVEELLQRLCALADPHGPESEVLRELVVLQPREALESAKKWIAASSDELTSVQLKALTALLEAALSRSPVQEAGGWAAERFQSGAATVRGAPMSPSELLSLAGRAARREFPHDSRGAELARKEYLRILEPDERR